MDYFRFSYYDGWTRSVPLYPNLKAESITQILEHSEAKLLFVGKLDDFESMRPGVPKDLPCIAFPFYSEEGYPVWDDLIQDVEPMTENVVRESNELATIIYTSGTTGMPKGLCISFTIFFCNFKCRASFRIGHRRTFFLIPTLMSYC